MAHFLGYLAVGDTAVPVGRFDVREAYNQGWTAQVALFSSGDEWQSLGSMVGNALAAGLVPGRAVVLRLGYVADGQDDASATIVRSWPGIISRIEPLDPQSMNARVYCLVTVIDIVSHLRRQTIWGCYRATPAAEMVGGAITLAAGARGAPTLSPAVASHPEITIVPQLRETLEWLPYSIAAGQTLGHWLDSFLGLLGIRMEMLGKADGTLSIILADGIPLDDPLKMSLPPDETVGGGVSDTGDGDVDYMKTSDGANEGDDGPQVAEHGELSVASLSARRGAYRRGVLLDDPTQGQLRRIGEGPVGTVVTGVEVRLDEAYVRAEQQLLATAAQLLVMTAETRQPGLRPGRRVTLDQTIRNIGTWQIHTVAHSLRGLVYGNRALLLNGAYAWYPRRPVRSAPVVVPGIVDGGVKFIANEPVPRDKLGRIPIRFPFLPLDAEEERLSKFDLNKDGKLNAQDFEKEIYFESTRKEWENAEDGWQQEHRDLFPNLATYDPNEPSPYTVLPSEAIRNLLDNEAREQDVTALRAGELDDPWPGRGDDELTDEQLEERNELAAKRALTYRFLAWRRARDTFAADADGDGYATLRDEEVSDELRQVIGSAASLRGFQSRVNSGNLTKRDEEVLEEYKKLFGDDPAPDWETHLARLDAKAAGQKWPARVPLSIVQPMAGGLHGFVAAHRHGDPCRVAVHDPLWAEVVGFEYRRHASLSEGLAGATAGVVVEHDRRSAWTGMLFRPTGEDEDA